MKISPSILGVILVAILLYACDSEHVSDRVQTFATEHTETISSLEQTVQDIYQDYGIQGDLLFAIVDSQGQVYSYSVDEDAHDETPIYIASHTKSFTGTLSKILEAQGEIHLSTPISKYIPDLNFQNKINVENINIQKLLSHTHGTFSTKLTWKTAYLGYSGRNAELIDDMNDDFRHDPSGRYRYSNVGPILASIALENTMNESWKTLMERHIFKPLSMDHTSAYVSDYTNDQISQSLSVNASNEIIDSAFYKKDITMHASGGVISTISDLSRWLSANIRQDTALMSSESWTSLHAPIADQDRTYFTYDRYGYSLGWDIADYQGQTILTRFGGLGGISFHISFVPDLGVGIIAYTNDNRAYTLPHLMANYVYNQLNNASADSLLSVEKEKFKLSFEKENNIAYPQESDLLPRTALNDQMKGEYYHKHGWPQISITSHEDGYHLQWGVLEGQVFQQEASGYLAQLGSMYREFSVKTDTLITGSLIYTRI